MIPYGLFSSIKSIARWTFLDKPSRKLQNKPPTFTVVPWQIQNPSEFYCSTLADTKPEWIAALSCFFAQVFIRLIDTMCGTRTSHFSLTSGLWLVDWQHSGNIPALCSDVRIFPVTEHIFIASKSQNEIAGQLSQWRAQQYLESVSWSLVSDHDCDKQLWLLQRRSRVVLESLQNSPSLQYASINLVSDLWPI